MMGEAKRRKTYNTFDGGPPSDRLIEADMVFFQPDAPLFDLGENERHCREEVLRQTALARRSGREFLCTTCDASFDAKVAPVLLFYMRPTVVKGPFCVISGGFCAACATRPHAQLRDEYVRAWNASGSTPTITLAAQPAAEAGEAERKQPTREDAKRSLDFLVEKLLRPLPSIFNSPRNRSVALSHILSAVMQVEEPPLAYDESATAADIAAVERITKIMADTSRDTPEFARMAKQLREEYGKAAKAAKSAPRR
jgi:hypothetical protein